MKERSSLLSLQQLTSSCGSRRLKEDFSRGKKKEGIEVLEKK
jgi:hypothetical protein